MGGPATAAQRLDHHFTQLNGGLSLPYFYIGNEPEHGVPWAYNFAAQPAGTADAVRRVMTESFTTGAGGLPGNDDLGATSAWYVWAALGMYPATPGRGHPGRARPAVPGHPDPAAGRQHHDQRRQPGRPVRAVAWPSTAPRRRTTTCGTRTSPAAARSTYTMGGSPRAWGTGAGDVPPSFNDGATQPAAAPDLGPNLALGKPVTGSAACATTESAAKAVDGTLGNNSKWCSNAAGAMTLTVDLGSAQTVASFVVKHAGLGGETTGWNTGAFTISTSTDNATWTTGGDRHRHRGPAAPTTRSRRGTARYVRLTVTTPTNNGNTAARIYELEVYGSPRRPPTSR